MDQDRDGYSSVLDCDDFDRSVRPGRVDNGIIGVSDAGKDNDCDGAIDEDGDDDQDGFINIDFGGSDCNDRLPNVFPGADDAPGDGIDSDCDGFDGDVSITDVDGDGASDEVDCNDRCYDIFPGAVERCDGVDTDCDGQPNISEDGLDSCLDGGIYDDAFTGVYTVDVLQEGEVVDSCSAPFSASIEDGRTPSEMMLTTNGTETCTLTSAFGGQTVQVQTTDASVAPWGMARGTLVLDIGSVTHEARLNGFVRADRLSGEGSFDTEDEALGPVTVRFTLGTTRTSEATDALVDDADFDGSPTAEDCNDNDPNVRPGATEACNGVDDNCNDDIDENACPADLPPAGLYGVNFSMQYHTGFNNTKQAPEPPAIAILVDEEMNATADNPTFVGAADASINVISAFTVNPPGESGSISGTLTVASDSVFPSGTMAWTGTVNSDGFTGIAVQHDRRLRRWTHVALTASAAALPTENDADFDGTPADVDCDDNDPTRRSDAHEVCNGIDDNCDGEEDQPVDDVCPHMAWAGESYPVLFSVLSDDGLQRWEDDVEMDVNINVDGSVTMDSPVFLSPAGASLNVVSMTMNPPGDDPAVSGTFVIESTVEGVDSGTVEWTGNVDSFGISGFALVGSGPGRWTHVAFTHRRSF